MKLCSASKTYCEIHAGLNEQAEVSGTVALNTNDLLDLSLSELTATARWYLIMPCPTWLSLVTEFLASVAARLSTGDERAL